MRARSDGLSGSGGAGLSSVGPGLGAGSMLLLSTPAGGAGGISGCGSTLSCCTGLKNPKWYLKTKINLMSI